MAEKRGGGNQNGKPNMLHVAIGFFGILLHAAYFSSVRLYPTVFCTAPPFHSILSPGMGTAFQKLADAPFRN
jgi:hypothetical protein